MTAVILSALFLLVGLILLIAFHVDIVFWISICMTGGCIVVLGFGLVWEIWHE